MADRRSQHLRPGRRRWPAYVLTAGSLLAVTGCAAPVPGPERPVAEPAVSTVRQPARSIRAPTVPASMTLGTGQDLGPGPKGVAITMPPDGVPVAGPAIVLVHGGAWLHGSPDDFNAWARTLARTGAVVFNVSYRLVGQPGGGYPGSVDDVACAVRYARLIAPMITPSDQLFLMGFSAGAQLAAVVALSPDRFGGDCKYPDGAPADALVGLGGVYDIATFRPFIPFMTGPLEDQPQLWASVNPVELAGRRDDLLVSLVTAAADGDVPGAQAEALAAEIAPERLSIDTVPGATHLELYKPEVVGLERLHLDWLARLSEATSQ